MEDIGDFVVFKQLVTSFCPQVLKYIYVYIYIWSIAHAPCFCNLSHGKISNQHKEKAEQEKVSQMKHYFLMQQLFRSAGQEGTAMGIFWACTFGVLLLWKAQILNLIKSWCSKIKLENECCHIVMNRSQEKKSVVLLFLLQCRVTKYWVLFLQKKKLKILDYRLSSQTNPPFLYMSTEDKNTFLSPKYFAIKLCKKQLLSLTSEG